MIRDEKIADAHREFEEDVEKVPGRKEEIPVQFLHVSAFSWLGESTNSTRSRKSCSAEKNLLRPKRFGILSASSCECN